MSTTEQQRQDGRLRRFGRFIFNALRNYFAFIGLLVTVIPILFFFTLMRMAGPTTSVSIDRPTPLTLDLNGSIAEREPGFEEQLFRRLFEGPRSVYLPELRSALRRAITDQNVESLVVRFGDLNATPAEYVELRRILETFKAGGKPIHVLLHDASDWSYYVATVANHIVLSPASAVFLTGPTFDLIYFGEALRKLGIDIDVVRAGKYKSAFEPFIQNEPSAPTLEQYESMRASLTDHMARTIAQGRGKEIGEVMTWLRRSFYTAPEALNLGLVDEIGYEPLAELLTRKEPAVSVFDYAATSAAPRVTAMGGGDQGIALIEAVGEISMGSASDMSDPDVIVPPTMRRQIDWAIENDAVKAVVLRVSSPGGSATASDVIWNDLKRLTAKKPLVVSMGAYAASGGYYISAPANHIVAEPTTITGSIGVIGMLPSAGAFRDKYGISFHVVTGSDRADLLNPGKRASAEDKALLDSSIEHVYRTFLSKVAEGRGLAVERVEELAQGRVYTGLEAKELGLVDEIGGLQAAFDHAKELAGLDREKLYPVLRYQGDDFNLRECLRNPMKLWRCLQARGVRDGWPLSTDTLSAAAGAAGFDAAARFKRWLSASRKEPALALWPAYLSLKWR